MRDGGLQSLPVRRREGDRAGEGGHKLEMGKQVGLYVNSERESAERQGQNGRGETN